MLSDMELVQLALADKEGSVEAREELLDRCKDVLSYHVVKYKNMYYGRLNQSDIEDLVSECHIAVLESIKLYNPSRGSGFSNFAKFVIKNRILNLLRDKVVRNKVIDFAVDVNAVKVAAPGIYWEKQVIVDDRELTERQKLIIAMFMDGYTQSEVARSLSLSRGRINQIVAQIRKYIKVEEHNE